MEELQNILNNNKGDISLYRIIFNFLSENNTLNNYTNNSNGILFNMNNFESDKIQSLYKNVNKYIENKKDLKNIEDNREKIILELSKTIDTEYKTELKNMIISNKKSKNNLSTHIDTDSFLIQKTEEKELKKKHNRIKKSVKKYQESVVYKGSYDRINKIISKGVRLSRDKCIEDEDKLYIDKSDNSISQDEEEYNIIESEIEDLSDNDLKDDKDPVSDSEIEELSDNELKNDTKNLFGSDSE